MRAGRKAPKAELRALDPGDLGQGRASGKIRTAWVMGAREGEDLRMELATRSGVPSLSLHHQQREGESKGSADSRSHHHTQPPSDPHAQVRKVSERASPSRQATQLQGGRGAGVESGAPQTAAFPRGALRRSLSLSWASAAEGSWCPQRCSPGEGEQAAGGGRAETPGPDLVLRVGPHSRSPFSPQPLESSRDWVQSFRSAGRVDDKALPGP